MSDPKCEYIFLGKTGVKVSNLCLGTMTFGADPDGIRLNQLNEEQSHRILDLYASYGGNFIDTANIYQNGLAERIVGSWLAKQDRRRFILATKVRIESDASDVNSVVLSRRNIIESCERSLERLQTNYIDLYQSHDWDAATPLDETLRTYDDLIRCGKVRYIGVSNFCGWQIQKTVDRLEAMGLNSCVSLQQRYNLICRQSELDDFVVCKNEGISVLPYSPLNRGLLTGKYQRQSEPEVPSRLSSGKWADEVATILSPDSKRSGEECYWGMMRELEAVAQTNGKTVSQVALRWLLQKDVVTSVIIGATSEKQIVENVGSATGWTLSDEEMARLDTSSIRLDLYPYARVGRNNRTRNNPYNEAHVYK